MHDEPIQLPLCQKLEGDLTLGKKLLKNLLQKKDLHEGIHRGAHYSRESQIGTCPGAGSRETVTQAGPVNAESATAH